MLVSERGRQQVTYRKDVRKFLNLVKATKKDVFCDLGCGNGKVCVWALEFVGESYGIEDYKKRFKKALKETKGFNVHIFNEDYRLFTTFKKLQKCTIFYSANENDLDTYEKIEKVCKPKTWFISFLFPPYPIKPVKYDGVFYATRTPFNLAKTKKEWLKSICKNGDLKELKSRYEEERDDWDDMLKDLNCEIEGFDWGFRKRKRL